jgi:hypothetical protein
MNYKEFTTISLGIVAFIRNTLFYTLWFFWGVEERYWPSKTANMQQVFTVLSFLGGGINDVSFAYHSVPPQKKA